VPANGLPVPADHLPVAAEDLPVPAEGLPVAAEGLPVPAGGLPVPANDLPVAAEDLPVAANGSLLTEGTSIRSAERISGTHRDTICSLLRKAGAKCEALLNRLVRNVEVRSIPSAATRLPR
jgi:hypothetical protein